MRNRDTQQKFLIDSCDVRGQVVEAVKADEANRIMVDKADQMLQAIAEGAEFAAAAEAVGAGATDAQLVARNAQNVDQSVAFAVFTAAFFRLGNAAIFADFPKVIGHEDDEDGRQDGDVDGVEITQRPLSDFGTSQEEIGYGRAHQWHIPHSR